MSLSDSTEDPSRLLDIFGFVSPRDPLWDKKRMNKSDIKYPKQGVSIRLGPNDERLQFSISVDLNGTYTLEVKCYAVGSRISTSISYDYVPLIEIEKIVSGVQDMVNLAKDHYPKTYNPNQEPTNKEEFFNKVLS